MSHAVDPPATAVRSIVARALAEDLEPLGDVTSALLPPDVTGIGVFVSRAEGVVAGQAAAVETFRQVDEQVDLQWFVQDGGTVEPQTQIAAVSGSLASILAAERTALNFLCHLSGIASLTRRFVRSSQPGCRIWDTRKTTPGLRALEKAAVRAGGGRNHRGSLSDWVLLKDNHLAGMEITEAVARARERYPGRSIQVEVDRLDQLEEAMRCDVDIVMLDNMSVDQVRACVGLRGDRIRPLLEASGGITMHNISEYSATGVDVISTSAITQGARALDIGLDITTTSR